MDKLWILGCRGSVSMPGPDQARYGGATTSVLLCLDGQYVMIDAGSGAMNLPKEAMSIPELPLLLTHLHLDHVVGLSMCPYLFRPEGKLSIYAGTHEGLDAEAALNRLFAPPVWPVTLAQLPAAVSFRPTADSFGIGAIRVDTMAGEHPNGVTVYRLSGNGKRVVFITDCTLTPDLLPKLTDFARNCDLLLCDGQFSTEEWRRRSGAGHNTWVAAARFALSCGAKAFRVIHHDPSHNDAVLDAADEEVRRIFPCGAIARQGEEILF